MNLKNIGFAILISLVLFFSGCSGKSEEDLLLETIEKIGEYAEDRDVDGILLYISDSYSDENERTIEDVEDLLAEYLEKYRGIVVNILGTKINELNPLDAVAEIETAFSSGAAKIFRKAVRYSGRCYRFKVEFVKEDEKWKVKYASWNDVSQDELFPESKETLKELFPNL